MATQEARAIGDRQGEIEANDAAASIVGEPEPEDFPRRLPKSSEVAQEVFRIHSRAVILGAVLGAGDGNGA